MSKNSVKKDIYFIINKETNTLTKKDFPYIKQLYFSIVVFIKNSIKDVKNKNYLGYEFWLKIIAQVIILVENYPCNGLKKNNLVIETISLIIKRDSNLSEKDKLIIINNFKKIAPQIIDIVITASKKLNIEIKSKPKNCCLLF